jgi:hypothetical protein
MAKHRYLLYCDGIGAVVELDPREVTSGDYGQIYDAFAEQAGKRRKDHFVDIVKLDRDEMRDGVFWDWELAGPSGASYRMHVLPGTDEQAVKKVKDFLRRSFDVVRLECNRIHKLIEFQMPALKHEQVKL